MQMHFILGCNINVFHLMLPDGVAKCKGYGRPSWITKCFILTNESRVDVARENVTVLMQTLL
jgi:hypothetical protein